MTRENTQTAPEVGDIIQRGARFLMRHRSDSDSSKRELSRSFGYFTKHPIAPLNRRRLEMIHATAQKILPRPGRILELGCGAGILCHSLTLLGHRVLGIDPDAREIYWAKLFGQEERLAGQFITGDATKLDQLTASIEDTLGGKPDIVLFAYALHHISNADALLNALGKWLPAGSHLLINEENPDSLFFRLKHVVRSVIQHDTHSEMHRTRAAWNQALTAAGFEPSTLVIGAELLKLSEKTLAKSPDERWSLVWSARKK